MSDALIGQVVGRCKIEKILGQGGMGAVYGGMHEALRIPVAVKFLSGGGQGTAIDVASAQRFMREAQTAATLRHPNIVRIYDVNSENGRFFIIMELLSGTSLTSLIEKMGPMPVDQVKHIGHQVAAALAHAHSRGVVHRDIKPDNVMLGPDGTAVLTDFGIAAAERAGEQKLTQQGVVVGTPWYLAPEQAQSGKVVDARADIYALGVMLYEMLTAALPFEGEDGIKQMVARLTTDPIPIQSRRSDLPPEIVTLIGRMLAREPENRIQSADEVSAALGATVSERTVLPPAAMSMTQEQNAVSVRVSELTQMADSAGLPFPTPQGSHMVELRMADIRATLRLAEEESAEGASLFLVHRPGEADIVAFVGKRAVASMRVTRGVPSALTLNDILGAAMKRGEGALVVRKIEAPIVFGLRCWLEGQRVLGPVPAEVIRPLGMFSRMRRTKSSGVMAVTDRGQTSLVVIVEGKVGGLLAAQLHKQEIATESEGGIGVWIESCSPESMLSFCLAASAAPDARTAGVPDEHLKNALQAIVDGVGILAADAGKEFGLGSAQVFSKYLREATSGIRDVVPVAAVAGQKGPVDVGIVWNSIASGANAGREIVVRAVGEALLTGTLKAAAEIIPAKKLPKSKQAALAAVMKSKASLDLADMTGAVQRSLGS